MPDSLPRGPSFRFSLRSMFQMVTVVAVLAGIFRLEPILLSLVVVELVALTAVFVISLALWTLTRFAKSLARRLPKFLSNKRRQLTNRIRSRLA